MTATRKKKTEGGGAPGSFEEALARLEGIVEELEGGEPALDRAVTLYEQGVGLFKYCRGQLDQAHKRVEELAGETEEMLSLQPFEDEEEDGD